MPDRNRSQGKRASLAHVRGILFDADGVLLFTPQRRRDRIRIYARRHGLIVPPRFDAAFHQAQSWLGRSDKPYPRDYDEEMAEWVEFYAQLTGLLGWSGDGLARDMAEQCHFLAWCRAYQDAAPALRRLHRHYRLGVVSNSPPSIINALQKLGLRRYLASITISATTGCEKPDPSMYLQASQDLGMPASHILMVDDQQANVQGALTAGMSGALLTRGQATSPLRTLLQIEEHLRRRGRSRDEDAV